MGFLVDEEEGEVEKFWFQFLKSLRIVIEDSGLSCCLFGLNVCKGI